MRRAVEPEGVPAAGDTSRHRGWDAMTVGEAWFAMRGEAGSADVQLLAE